LANIKSKEKRNRQSEKRKIRNNNAKSVIRTARKKLIKALESKDLNIETVNSLFKIAASKIDTAARKNIIKKNAAARYKSRLMKKVNAI